MLFRPSHQFVIAMLLGIAVTQFSLASQGRAQDVIGTLELEPALETLPALPTTSAGQFITINEKSCRGPEDICVSPQDEVWVIKIAACQVGCDDVSGEPVGKTPANCCCDSPFPQQAYCYKVRQLVDSRWQETDLDQLYQCSHRDDSHVDLVLAHGNNTDASWAITRAMQFYNYVINSDVCCRPPVRLIVLEWPSDRILLRPLPDYNIKSKRAVELGPHVASLLEPFGDHRPLLVGYSLGAQLMLSAVQCLRGKGESCDGSDDGGDCGCPGDGGKGFRIELIAPALDGDFACQYLADLCCDPMIDHAIVFANCRDRVVRASRLVARRSCGYKSAATSFLALQRQGRLDASQFELCDITSEVRARHSLINYANSPTIKKKTVEMLREASFNSVTTR